MMTIEQFGRKVSRVLGELRGREDKALRDHLKTLEGVRRRIATDRAGLRGQTAKDLLARAAQVFGEELADVDVEAMKREARLRQEIAGVVQGVGPVTEGNRLLFEQLRGNLRAELEPLFAGGDDSAIRSRFERLSREGAALELWVLLTTTADLHELHPNALGRVGGGDDVELLRNGPPELVAARSLAGELEAAWEEHGATPWAATVGARPDREREALRVLAEGSELLPSFEGTDPPLGFYPEGSAAHANADVNARLREVAGRGAAGRGAITGSAGDMNAAIRSAAGRGTTDESAGGTA